MMAQHETERQPVSPRANGEHAHDTETAWKHWGLMVLCCLPMIAIVVLVALGVWGLR